MLLAPARQRPTHHHSAIFRNIHGYGKYRMRTRYEEPELDEEEDQYMVSDISQQQKEQHKLSKEEYLKKYARGVAKMKHL